MILLVKDLIRELSNPVSRCYMRAHRETDIPGNYYGATYLYIYEHTLKIQLNLQQKTFNSIFLKFNF